MILLSNLILLTMLSTAKPLPLLIGGDVSEIPETEAAGGRYSYKGVNMDAFAIIKAAGWNFVRFRVWNEPKDGFCDKAHTLAMAKRAKAAGLAISIDFHYSDWWADPGHQTKPKKWESLSFPELKAALHDYTKEVVSDLVKQGTPPMMVQIGNEIGSGMLWPDAKTWPEDKAHWENLAELLKAGYAAVKEADPKQDIKVMIHLEKGADNAGVRWWFDHLEPYKPPFDAIGLSFYPFWHGSIEDFETNINDLATRYGKDLYVAEVAYPWTKDRKGHFEEIFPKLDKRYAPTPEGQAAFLERIKAIVSKVPGGRGKGILYWAPMAISTPSKDSAWDPLATFDTNGAALPAVDVLRGEPR